MALIDASEYNPNLPVENAYLEIVPPYFSGYIQVLYQPSHVTLLNTKNLRLSDQTEPLPSGLYTITQTIKPNDVLRNTQHFLFFTNEKICLAQLIHDALDRGQCPDDLFYLHSELHVASTLIESGKHKEGMKLFEQVSKKISHGVQHL
jgi:hypothetical protein